MRKVRAAKPVLFLVVVALSGCIMVRGGNLETTSSWPIHQEAGGKSISIEITRASVSGDKREQSPKKSLEAIEKQALRAYGHSGLFSRVALGTDLADLKAEVVVSGEEGRSNGFLRLINGMTLTLVPVQIEYSPTLKTVFKDSQGNAIGTIQKSEDV